MMPSLSLRLRMILLFCLVIGVILASTYALVYRGFVHEVRASFDERLMDGAQLFIGEPTARPSDRQIAGLEGRGLLMELVGPNGNVLEQSRTFSDVGPIVEPLPSGDQPVLYTVDTKIGRMRVAIIPIRVEQQPYWYILAKSTSRVEQVEASFRERAFGLWTVSLLLTTLIAAWYVGRSLRPIVDLNRRVALLTAEASSASRDLNVSLPIVNPSDELGLLATNFNVLFARIAVVVRQLRQFVSDAAHELRTPLSVVIGETQFLLSQPRSIEEYQRILKTIDGELNVMEQIIEGLFTLAMADAGQLQLRTERLSLGEVLEEACGIAAPRARRKKISIEHDEWAEVEIVGDQTLLRQLFLILLDNAVKYSPSHTRIRVGLSVISGHSRVLVRDEGFGIAPDHLPHIFERFYRAAPQAGDEPRSGGLGLAIAQAIVQAHRGEIRCESHVGAGSVFTLIFPNTATE